MANVSRVEVYSKGENILNPGDIVAVKLVTIIGHCDDFTVYQGLPDQSDEYVANYGDKVSEEIARAVAPYCAHLQYRW